MLLRALLVIASGFIFIFSPGLPMSLISRYSPEYKRDLVYWGIGVWLITLIPSLFIQSLIRQIFYQGQSVVSYTGQPKVYSITLINALISALFLGLGMLLVLKYKGKLKKLIVKIIHLISPKLSRIFEDFLGIETTNAKSSKEDTLINGLALGFGAGLVAQVFTGIILVGAGFRILFGDTGSVETLSAIANNSMAMVFASLAAVIIFRIALLTISAVQSFLIARSIEEGKGQFWVGILINTAFTWIILAIHLLMGEQIPGQVTVGITPTAVSIVTIVYYLLSFGIAYKWLSNQLKTHTK